MAQIREELILYDSFTNTFTKYLRYGEQAAGVTREAKRATDQFTRSQKAAASATNSLAGSLKSLAGGYIGLKGIQGLFNLSDTITTTTARLDMMNDGLQTTAGLNDMIWQSSQRARGSYQQMAAFVAKLGTLAGNAFDSNAEIVAFSEQINKQMALSGTTTQEAQAAMLQLTQGLASGVLRGEELNSVLEQTPMIAQTIAEYMGVTTGEMRELAAEGAITADVVKNAMFAAAEETNAKFAEMPLTWGQVWTQFQNIVVKALDPALKGISWLADHLDTLKPILFGVAAGAVALAIGLGIQAAATWVANGAAKAFFTTLLHNPLTYIVLIIGLVVAALYQWVQSMGGLEIAWLVVVDALLYAWDTVKAGFFTGVYFVMDLFDKLGLKIQTVAVSIQNFIGDMKVGVLNILQNMVNGAVDIINWFIDKVNKIPGVSIEPIKHATFAAAAAAENEAAKAARNEALEESRQAVESRIQGRADQLVQMWADRDANRAARQAEIAQRQAEQVAGSNNAILDASSVPYDEISSIEKSVKGIEKAVSLSDEDLKSLVDVAERRYVNQVNLTAQTPVITINGANTGRTAADRQNLANTIRDILVEQTASGSTRSTARAVTG